jgi:hypothetical protein
MRNLEKSKNIPEIAKKEKIPLQVIQLDVNNDGSVKDAIFNLIHARENMPDKEFRKMIMKNFSS